MSLRDKARGYAVRVVEVPDRLTDNLLVRLTGSNKTWLVFPAIILWTCFAASVYCALRHG